MPVRHGRPATFAARQATPKPRHLCIEATFVDDDQAAWVEIDLSVERVFSRGQNVRALLFARVRRLFLYVMPRFAKNSWTVLTPALTPRSARRSAISASVMSRSSVSTRARMNASCASSFESFGLPCRPGSACHANATRDTTRRTSKSRSKTAAPLPGSTDLRLSPRPHAFANPRRRLAPCRCSFANHFDQGIRTSHSTQTRDS